MPIFVPLPGADEGPSSEVVLGTTYTTIDIRAFTRDPAFESMDVEGQRTYQALDSINIKTIRDSVAGGSIDAGYGVLNISDQSVDIIEGPDFLILADLLQATLSGTTRGSFASEQLNAELKVNGSVVPIKSFRYEQPTGRLGSILNITLATPTVTPIPAGASVKFSIIVTQNGVTSSHVLMDNGKLQERSYTITLQGGPGGGPRDEVTFSSLDVIADKFGLAPRRPVVMYDPYRVRRDEVNTRVEQATRSEHGVIILPVLEPVVGLKMKQILARAYTGIGNLFLTSYTTGYSSTIISLIGAENQHGCGFTNVITNIPDYPVRRADFTIESGWHDGAGPVVAMYAPVYFVNGTQLFIIDLDRPLPYGITAHTVTLADHKSLSQRIEFKPDANAVLLTYQYSGNDLSEDPDKASRTVYTETVEDESTRGSTDEGWYKVTTKRWDREYFSVAAPDDVLDTLPLKTETETEQTVFYIDNLGASSFAGTQVTHRESTEYSYDGDLKIGHIRETFAAVASPDAGMAVVLISAEKETCTIYWSEDPIDPGLKIQDRVITEIEGSVVYDPSTTETFDDPNLGSVTVVRQIPILLAQSSGIVTADWIMRTSIPIKTIRETLHNKKGNQYDVEVIEIDHLNNTLKRSYVEPKTGTVSNDPYQAKSRTVLIRDTVSEALIGTRIPVPVNAYELPRIQALALGHRVVQRLTNPLQTLPIALAGVDFVIARGTIIKGQNRGGYTTNFFVTGYGINGTNLGTHQHRINQSIDASELLAAASIDVLIDSLLDDDGSILIDGDGTFLIDVD